MRIDLGLSLGGRGGMATAVSGSFVFSAQGQSYTGGAISAMTFDDPMSSQFVISSPDQTYTGGAITAQTFGS